MQPHRRDRPAPAAEPFVLTAPEAAAETLSGLVERVVFHNPETGFCVLRVKLSDQREPATVVGESAAVAPGEVVRADGQWQTDPTFGLQFRASILSVVPPSTLEGIEAYLGSGMIKGIGRAMAGKLVKAFGDQVFDVIERRPDRLREVPGIGRGLAERIAVAWRDQRAVRDIMLFLHSHGLSPLRAARIFEAYGARAIQLVRANPYRLAQEIRGIGFASADQLAARLGIPRDSPFRLRAGVSFLLEEAQGQGQAALPRAEVRAAAAELLGVDPAAIEAAITQEVGAGALIEDTVEGTDCLFLPAIHRAEREIAQRLRRLAGGRRAVDDRRCRGAGRGGRADARAAARRGPARGTRDGAHQQAPDHHRRPRHRQDHPGRGDHRGRSPSRRSRSSSRHRPDARRGAGREHRARCQDPAPSARGGAGPRLPPRRSTGR